tara:strand:+ start:257 stop:517 length:261 start_codon:yes stop_codon:yes gene_type:complete
MKKLISSLLVLGCLASFSLNAADAPKKDEPSPEVKAMRKEMMAKYDADKDGKLSKEERASMSDDDKAKMRAANGGGAGAGKKKKEN